MSEDYRIIQLNRILDEKKRGFGQHFSFRSFLKKQHYNKAKLYKTHAIKILDEVGLNEPEVYVSIIGMKVKLDPLQNVLHIETSISSCDGADLKHIDHIQINIDGVESCLSNHLKGKYEKDNCTLLKLLHVVYHEEQAMAFPENPVLFYDEYLELLKKGSELTFIFEVFNVHIPEENQQMLIEKVLNNLIQELHMIEGINEEITRKVAFPDEEQIFFPTKELTRKAAKMMMRELVEKIIDNKPSQHTFFSGNTYGKCLFEICNVISALTYEGSEGSGRIIFFNKQVTNIDMKIELKNPVSIEKYKSVRKLLEMTNANLHLLCDGHDIVGLGDIEREFPDKRSFFVDFTKKFCWEVQKPRDHKVLSVINSEPKVPKKVIEMDQFAGKFSVLFPEGDYKKVWNIVDKARKQKHGTMIVVTGAAKKEAKRLKKQAFRVKYLENNPDEALILSITNIDGAVLLDEDGRCHALGVILDGTSKKGQGDNSRGARYNSALRYLNHIKKEYNKKHNCLIVVISED